MATNLLRQDLQRMPLQKGAAEHAILQHLTNILH